MKTLKEFFRDRSLRRLAFAAIALPLVGSVWLICEGINALSESIAYDSKTTFVHIKKWASRREPII